MEHSEQVSDLELEKIAEEKEKLKEIQGEL